MHVVFVEFIVEKEHVDAFLTRMKQQARDSLAKEPACQVFDVCVDRANDHRILLYEVYESAAAFQAHLDSEHFKAFDAEVRDWVTDKRVEQYQRLQP